MDATSEGEAHRWEIVFHLYPFNHIVLCPLVMAMELSHAAQRPPCTKGVSHRAYIIETTANYIRNFSASDYEENR